MHCVKHGFAPQRLQVSSTLVPSQAHQGHFRQPSKHHTALGALLTESSKCQPAARRAQGPCSPRRPRELHLCLITHTSYCGRTFLPAVRDFLQQLALCGEHPGGEEGEHGERWCESWRWRLTKGRRWEKDGLLQRRLQRRLVGEGDRVWCCQKKTWIDKE